jgi:hypothetical protein
MGKADGPTEERDQCGFDDDVKRTCQQIGEDEEENVCRDRDGGEEDEEDVRNFGLWILDFGFSTHSE